MKNDIDLVQTAEQMNRDERLLVLAVLEASRVCHTLAAQTVFVLKKMQRVQASRLAKVKQESAPAAQLGMLEKHRAEHYATALPYEVLEDEVDNTRRGWASLNSQQTQQLEERIRNNRVE